MASVYRKKSTSGGHVKNWYCFFRVPTQDGGVKQVHRSTGKATKKEALEAARQIEQAELEAAGVSDKTQKAILSKVSEAAELALKHRLNPAAARVIISDILELAGQGASANYTLRSWAQDWIKDKEATTKESTAAFYRSTVNEFVKYMDKKADLPIEAIATADIRQYRDSVKVAGRAAKTCNHKLKALRSLFGDAVKHAALNHNPTSPIKSLDERDSVERLPFTLAEVSRLVNSAPSDEWRGMVLLGAFTGIRISDAANLKAGNIDLKLGVLRFTPMKTSRKGTVVEIPLHAELLKFFDQYGLPAFDGAPLFPTLSGRKTEGRNGLSALFREQVMKAARIDRHVTRKTKEGAARDNAKRSFHSLRHTFTSWLASANIPEEVRMKMTGHTESRTHQKYTHHELATLQQAVDSLEGLKLK